MYFKAEAMAARDWGGIGLIFDEARPNLSQSVNITGYSVQNIFFMKKHFSTVVQIKIEKVWFEGILRACSYKTFDEWSDYIYPNKGV